MVSWKTEERPQLIKGEENPYPFLLPVSRDESKVVRIIPTPAEANHANAVALMGKLLSTCPQLSFEVVAEPGGTYWQIASHHEQFSPEAIIDHIKTHYPDVATEYFIDAPLEQTYPFYRQMVLFGLSNEYAAPLPFFSTAKLSHLTTIANRMELLSPDLEERISYRLITFSRSAEAENRAGRRLVHGTVKSTSGLFNKTDPFFGMDEKLLNAKLDQPHYHAFLTLTVESRDQRRLPTLIQSAKDITSIAQPRHNSLIEIGDQPLKHIVETPQAAQLLWFDTLLTASVRRRMDEWRRFLLVLSPDELATLWHIPDERFTASRIAWKGAGIADDLTKTGKDRVCIGDGEAGTKKTPVYVAPGERITHTVILGKNGTGKSTLLHNLIHQDIAAGRGVVVIDPHGELTQDILNHSIPASRQEDVVLLACGNSEVPVPLNPFRIPTGISFEYANTYLYWLLRKIYASIWVEGRMDFTMKNVIQALLCDPEATPLDISRLFSDDPYRELVLAKLNENDDIALSVVQYWQQFSLKTRGERNEIAQPIINRTGAFLGNRALELMTCHPKSLNFKELLSGGKIVLVNLAGDGIKTEANNLGAIVLAHLYLASQSLGFLPKDALPRSYLYIDEADRFIDSPLPEMFSEARKYGLAVTLASQYLSRFPKDTQGAIFGNVGSQYLFEVGIDDAKTLEKYVSPLTQEDLINLGKYRMMVKTRASGSAHPAFLVTTRSMPDGKNAAFEAPPLAATQGFLPKPQVSTWLKARYAPPPVVLAAKPEAEKPVKSRTKKKPTDGLKDYE